MFRGKWILSPTFVGNMGTTCTRNSEVTGAALSITTNKKDEVFAVNCLDSIDLALNNRRQFDKRLRRFYMYLYM